MTDLSCPYSGPERRNAAPPVGDPTIPEDPGAPRPRVLFVDDEPALLQGLTRTLYREFDVTTALSGKEALGFLEEEPIEIVVSDMAMPEMNGLELLTLVRDRFPDVITIMLTGMPDQKTASDAINDAGIFRFLAKPSRSDQVATAIRDAVVQRRLLIHREKIAGEMALARSAASAASRAKSQFLATISHELRTPLNAVIGLSEMIASEALGPLGDVRYRGFADTIVHSGSHLLTAIDDILGIAKAEAGHLDWQDYEVDPTEVLREAIALSEPHAVMRSVSLIDAVEQGLPIVCMQRQRLRQALLYILSNAIKFTPPDGSVVVSAAVVQGAADVGQPESWLEVRVADTGIGLRSEDIPLAFEPFVQIDGGLDRKFEGVGLGLSIAARLVELHRGTLQLESAGLGLGATVTIRLPLGPVMKNPIK